MNLPETSGLVVWLLPSQDQSHLFSKFILNLSDQYSSFPFIPHVTLSRVPVHSTEKIIELTDRISKRLSPLRVEIGKIECRSHPFRKVIMPVDDVIFQTFYYTVNNGFGGAYCKERDFHLSLLYGDQKCEEIDLMKIERETPAISELHLQKIAVVDLNFTPDKWKIIFERSL